MKCDILVVTVKKIKYILSDTIKKDNAISINIFKNNKKIVIVYLSSIYNLHVPIA